MPYPLIALIYLVGFAREHWFGFAVGVAAGVFVWF